jgi:hypothetical protein
MFLFIRKKIKASVAVVVILSTDPRDTIEWYAVVCV